MGDLGSHTVAGVGAAIAAAGCRLLDLAPHRPDPNPVELAFGKLKRLLRTAAERTVDGLLATTGRLFDRSPPAECRR